MQFVRTAQFKHKHLLALYSHSPRRTGGPQAPASGALVYYIIQVFYNSSAVCVYSVAWCCTAQQSTVLPVQHHTCTVQQQHYSSMYSTGVQYRVPHLSAVVQQCYVQAARFFKA